MSSCGKASLKAADSSRAVSAPSKASPDLHSVEPGDYWRDLSQHGGQDDAARATFGGGPTVVLLPHRSEFRRNRT